MTRFKNKRRCARSKKRPPTTPEKKYGMHTRKFSPESMPLFSLVRRQIRIPVKPIICEMDRRCLFNGTAPAKPTARSAATADQQGLHRALPTKKVGEPSSVNRYTAFATDFQDSRIRSWQESRHAGKPADKAHAGETREALVNCSTTSRLLPSSS